MWWYNHWSFCCNYHMNNWLADDFVELNPVLLWTRGHSCSWQFCAHRENPCGFSADEILPGNIKPSQKLSLKTLSCSKRWLTNLFLQLFSYFKININTCVQSYLYNLLSKGPACQKRRSFEANEACIDLSQFKQTSRPVISCSVISAIPPQKK